MFKEEGVECVDHCDRFYLWLKACGINSNRGSIVHSIAERYVLDVYGIVSILSISGCGCGHRCCCYDCGGCGCC
jgi:hypothetical protein